MSKQKTPGFTRRVSGLMALEQRFMFDGAAVADALQVLDAAPAEPVKDVLSEASVVDSQVDSPDALIRPAAPLPLLDLKGDHALSALHLALQAAELTVSDFLRESQSLDPLFELFSGGQDEPSQAWRAAAEQLRADVFAQVWSLPVALRPASDMQGALGAFAAQGTNGQPTLYLNADYAAHASSEALVAVLLEEIGHAIDHRLNPGSDSPGDEGHAFASRLLNGADNAMPGGLENDQRSLQIEGQTLDVELSGALNIAQLHYVPMAEGDIQTSLKAINSATTGNIQTVIAITATSNGTVVVYDQWEDGYEVDINNPTQLSTQFWTYNTNQWFVDANRDGIRNNGEANVTGTGIRVSGNSIILTNAVNPTSPATVDFDGRDKVGSTKAISVTRAGWSITPGTVLAGAVNVIDSGNAGKVYTLPVGQNVETVATGTNKLFEYTSAHIIATQNATTVTVDRDGNGTTDLTITLNEGQSYLVNGGLNAGARITSDKGVGVYLIAGDVGSTYENRWFALTPDEQWASSYYAPVSTTLTANPAYVVIYNPDGANIRYETVSGSGTITPIGSSGTTWASNGTTKTSYFLMPASAARFYTTDTDGSGNLKKFYAVSVIDADATDNQTHDWSYSLVPETYLTDKFVVGWGPGADNVTRSFVSTDLNASPVWVTPVGDTVLYIDSATVTVRDAAGNTVTGVQDGSTSTYKYTVKRLQSYRLFDTDKDQTGLTVYTKDGTLITAAWGEDPSIAGPGAPYLDMGTTVTPFPDYVLAKVADENNPADSNTTVQLGEEVKYTVTLTNRAVIDLFDIVLKDSITPIDSAEYVANSTVVTVYTPEGKKAWSIQGNTQTFFAADGVTVSSTVTNTGLAGSAFPLAGSGFRIQDLNPSTPEIDGLKRGGVVEVTYLVKIRETINKALSDADYTVTNSVTMTGTGVEKNKDNQTLIVSPVTDGEVFFVTNSTGSTVASDYSVGSTIYLKVADGDQNISAGTDNVWVKVTNTTTSEYEYVQLQETSASSGVFVGSLNTVSGVGTSADSASGGNLKMVAGNSLKVEYVDPRSLGLASPTPSTTNLFNSSHWASGIDNPTNWGITPATYTLGSNNNSKSLVISAPPSVDGKIEFLSFNAGTYGSALVNFSEGNTLGIQVTDAETRYTGNATQDQLTVQVTNITTGETETVTLTETGNTTGIFRGNLTTSTSTSAGASEGGVLRMVFGDQVKVEYSDTVTGNSYDNPSAPGLPNDADNNTATGHSNRDLAQVVKIKELYLSADAVSADGTGDLDRIDPGGVSPADTVTDSTFTLTGTEVTASEALISVPGLAQGLAQSVSSTNGNRLAQSFTMVGTSIGKVTLDLRDDETGGSKNNAGTVFAHLRASLDGPNLASASISGSTLTTSYQSLTFNFSDVTGLTAGATYFIVLDNQSSDTSGNDGDRNIIRWGSSSTGVYAGGQAFNAAGAAQSYDFRFAVFNRDGDSSPAVSNSSGSSYQAVTGAANLFAQSFTVSGSGSYGVDKVKLSIKDADNSANTGSIYVHLRGAANGSNLASARIDASTLTSAYQNIDFDFANNPSLSKGTTYFVVLDNQSSASIHWEYTGTSTYSGGSYWANSSSASATYSANTAQDFIVDVYDTTGTRLVEVANASNKRSISASSYGGQSFNVSGAGTYTVDKVRLLLDDPDSTANTGNLTLNLRSGSVNGGTVLATATVAANTLSRNGVPASVTFDLPNTSLNKGTTYFLQLVNGSNNTINWAQSNYDLYAGGVAYENSTSAVTARDYQFDLLEATTSQISATFTQSIAMAEPFNVPAGGAINIVSYVSGVSGGTPEAGNIQAKLSYGTGAGTTIVDLSAFSYEDLGGGTGRITWTGEVSNAVNIAAGQALKLTITNNQSGLALALDYDSSTKPSRIELPTTTVIRVVDVDGADANGDGDLADAGEDDGNGTQLIGFYDAPWSAGGGSLIDSSSIDAGGTVYVRVKVADPFGAYDVTGLGMQIDGPELGGDRAVQLTAVDAVEDNGPYRVFEYAWTTVNNVGVYNVSVTAREGFENAITASATGTFAVTASDTGTPSATEFLNTLTVGATPGELAGRSYSAGDSARLRVTDLDQNADGTIQETVTATVNGVTVTLTETGPDTGIFEAALPLAFQNLAQGAVLNASYTDPNDPSDTSADNISVPVPDNTDPVATPNARTVAESATLSGGNLMSSNEGSGADSDADSDNLLVTAINGAAISQTTSTTVTTINLPSGASLTVRPDGAYTYNPNGAFNYLDSGETSSDTFTYTISDGRGGVSTAIVSITITGIADPGISVPDNNGSALGQESVAENASFNGKTFTVSAPAGLSKITIAGTDVTLAQLNAASTSPVTIPNASGNGPLIITGFNSGTGVVTYSYDPAGTHQNHSAGDNSIVDRVTLTVTDVANTVSEPNSLGLLITDTAPTANADTDSVTENIVTTATGNVITGSVISVAGDANATDGVADTLGADAATVTGVQAGTVITQITTGAGSAINGTYGRLTVNANGDYIYTLYTASDTGAGATGYAALQALANGASQTDVFSYTLKDADGDFSNARVTITVNGTNDVPAVTNQSRAVTEDANTVADDPNTLATTETGAFLTATGQVTVIDPDTGESTFNTASLAYGTRTNNGSTGSGRLGALTIDANGNYIFSADNSDAQIQALAAGNSIVQTWTVTSSDGSATSTITITINGVNDGQPTFAINDVTVNEAAGTMTFTVTKTGATTQPSSVQYSFASGTATTGGTGEANDYTGTAGTLNFAANETTQTITVTINNDGVYEGAESFNVNLANASGATIADGQGVGTIKDDGTGNSSSGGSGTGTNDDRPTFAINDVTVNEAAGTMTFTVTKAGATTQPSSVQYSFASGTATTGGTGEANDYTGTAGTLNFAANETTQTITVTINNDGVYEGAETFNVNLANVSGATIADGQGVGTIKDDGTGNSSSGGSGTGTNDDRPTFAINDVTVNEAAGTMTFTVTKAGATTQPSSVQYSFASGTATTGGTGEANDYTGTAGTLNFAANETTQTITVTINNDGVYEGTESFNVNLANASGATIADGQGVGTIKDDGTGNSSSGGSGTGTDDDRPTFAINDVTVNEAAGTMTFTVTKTGATTQPSSVQYSFASGTATTGGTGEANDYTGTAGTLNFAANETTQTITVTINNDGVYEGAESFNVNLANASGATIADGQGVGTIKDDGTGNSSSGGSGTGTNDDRPTFAINDVTVNEAAGTMTFTVTKAGATTQPSSVQYSFASGTATTGGTGEANDYTGTAGTLNFAANETTQTITVTINNDGVYEGTESFNVNLANASGATIADGQGVGTIKDDGTGNSSSGGSGTGTNDDRPTFAINDVTVNEAAGTMTFTVTKTGATTQPSSVQYSFASGTATTGGTGEANDYTGTAGTLNFAANETTQTITVTINNDGVYEGAESFNVNLANASGATIADGQGVGTIKDDGTGNSSSGGSGTGTDDDRPTFAINDVTVNEAAGTMTFTVTKTGATTQPSSVQYSFASGTATTGGTGEANDYTGTAGTLNFAANETTQTITVTINNDGVYEGAESFNVNLANASGATIADGQGVGTIKDDGTGNSSSGGSGTGTNDDRPTFAINDVTVNEAAGTMTFTVTKAGATTQPSSVQYSFASGTATTGGTGEANDYTGTAGTLNFAANETTQTITVTINNDGVYEGAETFNVNLANVSGATIADGQGVGTIKDDGTGNSSSGGSGTGTDDDRPTFAINDVTVNEAAGTMTFTVTKTGATTQPSSVQYSFASGTATTGGTGEANDYTGTAGTLNFAANETTQTITVTINNDGVYEGAESFNVNLANASGATIADGQGVGTIKDDGTGNSSSGGSGTGTNDDRPTFAINDVTVNEAAGTMTFTVTKAGATTQPSSVQYSFASGTATTGGTGEANDYTGTAGTLNFAANETTQTITVTINNDGVYEGAETFNVNLANVSGATIADGQGVGTIKDDGTGNSSSGGSGTGTDDDRGIAVTGLDKVSEGSDAVFTVILTDGNARDTVITLSLSHGDGPTDAESADYSASFRAYFYAGMSKVELAITDGKVVLPAGVNRFYVNVPTSQDTELERAENFSLTAAISGGKSATGSSTILDDGNGLTHDDQGLNGVGPGDDDRTVAAPPTVNLQPTVAAPVIILPPTSQQSSPTQVFASTLTPLAPALKPADPPLSLIDAVTSGSGYQIPVSETAPQGLSLYQGVTDQFVQTTGAATKISLPFDAFIHTNRDAVIRLQAKQADDSNLPSWVKFDPASGVFEVAPPPGFRGKLDLKVIARDDDGREAVAIFQMFVGEQQVQQRSQGRESFTEKLRMAGKRPITLVRVSDAQQRPTPSELPARESFSVRTRAG